MEKIGDNIYKHEGRRYGIKENGDIFQIPHDILPTQGVEEKNHHIDHTHCWNQKSPACGQKIEHLKCCLCEKLNPKAQGAEVNLRELTKEEHDSFLKPTPPSEKKTIEVNMFNRDFVEGARNAGFTDTQINFLAEHFEFKSEEYE